MSPIVLRPRLLLRRREGRKRGEGAAGERARKGEGGEEGGERRGGLGEGTAGYQAAGKSLYGAPQASTGGQPGGDGAAPEAEKRQDDVAEADYEIVDEKK